MPSLGWDDDEVEAVEEVELNEEEDMVQTVEDDFEGDEAEVRREEVDQTEDDMYEGSTDSECLAREDPLPSDLRTATSERVTAETQAKSAGFELPLPQVPWPKENLACARERVAKMLDDHHGIGGCTRTEAAWRSLENAARNALSEWSRSDTWQDCETLLMILDVLFDQVETVRRQNRKFPTHLLLLLVVAALEQSQRSVEMQELLQTASEDLHDRADSFESESVTSDFRHMAALLLFRAALLAVWNGAIETVDQLYDIIDKSVDMCSGTKRRTALGEGMLKRQKITQSNEVRDLACVAEKTLRDLAWRLTQDAFQRPSAADAVDVMPPLPVLHRLVAEAEGKFSAAAVRDAVVRLAMRLGPSDERQQLQTACKPPSPPKSLPTAPLELHQYLHTSA